MIADAVFAWGDRQPEKTALDHNGVCWSYRMFCDQIMRARGHFHALGLEGGGIVVVAVEDLRSSWTSSLALRSLGVTTVPVSSAWEIGQLGIPELAAVAALGAERWKGLSEVCAAQGLRLVPAYAGEGTPKAYDPSTRPGGHIMLSSGTTGVRKKVLMDPSFEVAYLRRRMRGNGIDHDSVVCVITHPPWTSVGYKHPAAAWLAGGTVVLSQGQPYRLALARPDLTECMLIPGMLADALAEPAEGFPRHETMRLAITAGTVTRAQIAAAKARISPIVVNSLAATEGNGIAVTPFETDEDHRWHRPSEGIIQVVDDDDRVLPPGRLGRLRVDTKDAPQGYLFDEEATRACFRAGFFYPGDLAITAKMAASRSWAAAATSSTSAASRYRRRRSKIGCEKAWA